VPDTHLAASNPVALHVLDALRPVQIIKVLKQPAGDREDEETQGKEGEPHIRFVLGQSLGFMILSSRTAFTNVPRGSALTNSLC